MPLVRIDLPEGNPAEYRAAAAEVIYRALVDVAGAPAGDRFIVITEHERDHLLMDPHYIVERTGSALIIQIVFNQGRSISIKKALYRAIADGLHEQLGLRTEDVMITLIEVPKENWSFGQGEMQYAD